MASNSTFQRVLPSGSSTSQELNPGDPLPESPLTYASASTKTANVHPSSGTVHASPDRDELIFPPCANIGDNAQIWKTYVKETDQYDTDMIKAWNDGIENFLVFTGLFSAILSAFLIYSWALLQPDNVQATVNGLVVLSQQLTNMSSGQALDESLAYRPEPFFVPSSAVAVNGLWLTGLFISLSAAATAMLVKEWLTAYTKDLPAVPLKRVEERQLRYNGLCGWEVQTIITCLPLAIHLALFLFFIGLVIFAWPVCVPLSIWMSVLLGIAFFFYCASALAPIAYEACPYKSPLYSLASGLGSGLKKFAIWKGLLRLTTDVSYDVWPILSLRLTKITNWRIWSTLLLWLWCLPRYVPLRRKYSEHLGGHRPGADAERGASLDGLRESFDDAELQTFPAYVVASRKRYALKAERKKAELTSKTLPAKTRKQISALQAEAVSWLVKSTDESAQDVAIDFLSWWRMPSGRWTSIESKTLAAAERKVELFNSIRDTVKPEESQAVRLTNLLTARASNHIQQSTKMSWKIGIDSDLRRLLPLTFGDEVAGSEFALCIIVECLCPIAVGANFDQGTAIQGLSQLAARIPVYPGYQRFVMKYLDLLDLLTRPLPKDRDAKSPADENWECRYPAVSPDAFIGILQAQEKLRTSIDRLQPNALSSPAWDKIPKAAETIRCTLIERLANLPPAGTSWRSRASDIARWIERGSDAPLADRERIAIRQLILSQLLKTSDMMLFWHHDCDGFRDCLKFLGSSSHEWDCPEDVFDSWFSGLKLDDLLGYSGRRIVQRGDMMWILVQIEMSTTPLCIPAIVAAYAALHWRAAWFLVEPGEVEMINALSLEKWLACMHTYGLPVLSSYAQRSSEADTRKLHTMFEACIRVLRRKREQEVEACAPQLLDDYEERFGVNLRVDDADPTPLEPDGLEKLTMVTSDGALGIEGLYELVLTGLL